MHVSSNLTDDANIMVHLYKILNYSNLNKTIQINSFEGKSWIAMGLGKDSYGVRSGPLETEAALSGNLNLSIIFLIS